MEPNNLLKIITCFLINRNFLISILKMKASMKRIPLKKQYHTSKVLKWLHCKSYRIVLFLTQKQCQHWDIKKIILTVLLTKIFIMLSLHSFGYVTNICIFLASDYCCFLLSFLSKCRTFVHYLDVMFLNVLCDSKGGTSHTFA